MRNLKRALSLALASVMLLGMMVVGTSAKGIDGFGDADSITNVMEATITSDIGVFDGYDDGNFHPTDPVTRAQMAVIICKMLYGADVDVTPFVELNTFSDVPAWAQGWVNLCASLGIVAGVGGGKYDPNATVTTAQAAKMLCSALGWFQNNETDPDWELVSTAKATELGLYGEKTLSAKSPLARDDVAVMVFNALTQCVPVQYNELLNVYYNENQGIIYSYEFNYLETLGYKNFDLVYKSDTRDIYGRPAVLWGKGTYNTKNAATASGVVNRTEDLTEDGELKASLVRILDKDEIYVQAITPDYVYTVGTKNKAVFNDLGRSVCDESNYTWSAYVNGELQDKPILPIVSNNDEYIYTGEGTQLEIYVDDGDETVRVVEINYYLGQVASVRTDDDGEFVTISELSEDGTANERTFHIEGFAEDDYVVYTLEYDELNNKFVIGEVLEPTTVTGVVTRVENDTDKLLNDPETGYTYLKIDDAKYIYTEDYDADPDTDEAPHQDHMVYDLADPNEQAHPTLNEDYLLYLDPNGFVLAFTPNTEAPDQYLYIADSDEEMLEWVARAELADATSPKIDVKKTLSGLPATLTAPFDHPQKGALANNPFVDGKKNNSIHWINPDGAYSPITLKDDTNIDKLIWKYSVSSSGVYELTYIQPSEKAIVDTVKGKEKGVETQWYMDDAAIKNGKAYVQDEDLNYFIVDKKTIFVDTMNDKVYTGYDEVPNIDNAKVAYALDGRVADIVFVLDGDIYDTNSVRFILASDKRESLKYDGQEYWQYLDAYVDGVKTPIIVKYNADGANRVLEVGQLYQVKKVVDEEYYTEVAKTGDFKDTATEDYNRYSIWAVGVDAFWASKKGAVEDFRNEEFKFDTDDETIFVVVEKTLKADGSVDKYDIFPGSIKDMKIDAERYDDQYIEVVSQSSNHAKLVYIYRTLVDVTVPGGASKKGNIPVEGYNAIANGTIRVSSNGLVTFNIDYQAPEWVATDDGSGHDVTGIKIQLMEGDDVLIPDLEAMITANRGSMNSIFPSGVSTGLDLDEDGEATISGTYWGYFGDNADKLSLKIVGDKYAAIKVRYFLDSTKGEEVTAELGNDTLITNKLATKTLTTTANGGVLNFSVNNTADSNAFTIGDDAKWSVENVTVVTAPADYNINKTSGKITTPTTNMFAATGTGYVNVILTDVTRQAKTYSVTVHDGTPVAEADKKATSNPLSVFGFTQANYPADYDSDLTITATATHTGLKPTENYNANKIQVKLGDAPTDVVSYKVTIKGLGSVVLNNTNYSNATLPAKALSMANGDIVITRDMITVEVEEYKFAPVSGTWSNSGNTVEIKFNESIDMTSTSGTEVVKTTNWVWAQGTGTNSTDPTIISAALKEGTDDTIVLTYEKPLEAGNTIKLNSTDVQHSSSNKHTANNGVELKADGTVAAKNVA